MAPQDHLLIVDDDPDICTFISDFFEKNGFKVSISTNGKNLQEILDYNTIDLVVLDLVLPDEDGLVLCRNLRSRSSIPVIILSARGGEMDRIIGLEMGADDYLPKPFHPRELLARVKSVLRRSRTPPDDVEESEQNTFYRFAGWTLEVPARQLHSPRGEKISLSGGEFSLLKIFLDHPNRVLPREKLLVYSLGLGRGIEPFDRTIDMQVSRLRRRLQDNPKRPNLIKTVRSVGYIFSVYVEKGGSTP